MNVYIDTDRRHAKTEAEHKIRGFAPHPGKRG